MPKRKRDGRIVVSETDRVKAEIVRQILLGKRQITRSLKLAKGFERQKLGRKEKEAREKKEEGDIQRIEAEIQALKKIDIPTSAEHHLHKLLSKSRRLKSSQLLPPDVTIPSKIVVDKVTADVTARLYNAKLVKASVAQTLVSIQAIVGSEGVEEPALKGQATDKNEALPAQKQHVRDKFKEAPSSTRDSSLNSVLEENEAATSHTTGNVESDESESERVDLEEDSNSDNEAYADFEGRIASSSDDDEEEEAKEAGKNATDLRLKRELLASVLKSPDTVGDIMLTGTKAPNSAVFTNSSENRTILKSQSMSRNISSTQKRSNSRNPMTLASEKATVEAVLRNTDRFTAADNPGTRIQSKRAYSAALSASAQVLQSMNGEDQSHLRNPADMESHHATKKDKRTLTGIGEVGPRPILDDVQAERNYVKKEKKNKLGDEDGLQSPQVEKKRKKEKKTDNEAVSSGIPKKRAKADRSEPIKGASNFVPALAMMGAYWSGSESEPSDIEDHVAPRKNRRGQRARQAIAELKYKSGAKHLLKEAKGKGRDDGWDLKRGATSRDQGWRKGNGSTWGGPEAKGGASGSNAVPVASMSKAIFEKRKKDDDGPLHPSWQAKKDAKPLGAIVAFTGKKITFS